MLPCRYKFPEADRPRAVEEAGSMLRSLARRIVRRSSEALLEAYEEEGITFIPFFPLAIGEFAKPEGRVAEFASRLGATPAQVALAWLLARSPAILAIPGTSSVAHLEENIAAAALGLPGEEVDQLAGAAPISG